MCSARLMARGAQRRLPWLSLVQSTFRDLNILFCLQKNSTFCYPPFARWSRSCMPKSCGYLSPPQTSSWLRCKAEATPTGRCVCIWSTAKLRWPVSEEQVRGSQSHAWSHLCVRSWEFFQRRPVAAMRRRWEPRGPCPPATLLCKCFRPRCWAVPASLPGHLDWPWPPCGHFVLVPRAPL